jgi:hypothetical protein
VPCRAGHHGLPIGLSHVGLIWSSRAWHGGPEARPRYGPVHALCWHGPLAFMSCRAPSEPISSCFESGVGMLAFVLCRAPSGPIGSCFRPAH